MAEKFKNDARSTLASGILDSDLELDVAPGHGARFPSTGDFRLKIVDPTDASIYEYVKVTARSTDTLTIVRAQETTSALEWETGAKVLHTLTAAGINGIVNDAQEGIAAAQADADAALAAVGDLLNWQFVRKTSAESVTSSTTLQDDNLLLFPIAANEVWDFKIVVFWTDGSPSADIKWKVTGPTGCNGAYGTGDSDTAIHGETIGGSFEFTASGAVTGATDRGVIVVNGLARNGSTAGDIKFRWAQSSSSAAATQVEADSYLVARRVA